MKRKQKTFKESLHELWQNTEEANIRVRGSSPQLSAGLYSRDETETRRLIVNQRYLSTSQKLFSKLNVGETRLVTKIMADLKYNNALWRCDEGDHRGRMVRVISSLVKKKVLIRTPHRFVYIVNPFAIRHGSLPNVIAATLQKIEGPRFNEKSPIRALRAPENSFLADLQLLSKVEDPERELSRDFL